MSAYQEAEAEIEVPPNAGVAGFLHAIRQVMRYPRVMEIHINPRGIIRFVRHVRKDEAVLPVQMDFESVTPAAVLRAAHLTEIEPAGGQEPGPVAVARMFEALALDQVSPVAFIVGPQSLFPTWHKRTSGVSIGAYAYGVPVLQEDRIPAETLVLCASYSPGGSLSDVQRAYKLTLPVVTHEPSREPALPRWYLARGRCYAGPALGGRRRRTR